MKKYSRIFILSITFALVFSGCQLEKKPAKQTITGFYFDTFVTITAYCPDDTPLEKAMELCAYYDQLLSTTVESSDVWRINNAQGAVTQVSDETRVVIEKALDYGEISQGKFDITIAPCTQLWDFTGESHLPDLEALQEAASFVNYKTVQISEDGVQLEPNQSIDLGAIAKGYVADCVSNYFIEVGVESAIMDFGGNIQTVGSKPDGTPWDIGIADPFLATGMSAAVIPVTGKAVVTSGVNQRGFDLDGVRYHHLLDSETGMPIQNQLQSVTVVTDHSFDGDVISTTLFALGEVEGLALAEELDGVEAVFIANDGTISYTSALEGKIHFINE